MEKTEYEQWLATPVYENEHQIDVDEFEADGYTTNQDLVDDDLDDFFSIGVRSMGDYL